MVEGFSSHWLGGGTRQAKVRTSKQLNAKNGLGSISWAHRRVHIYTWINFKAKKGQNFFICFFLFHKVGKLKCIRVYDVFTRNAENLRLGSQQRKRGGRFKSIHKCELGRRKSSKVEKREHWSSGMWHTSLLSFGAFLTFACMGPEIFRASKQGTSTYKCSFISLFSLVFGFHIGFLYFGKI